MKNFFKGVWNQIIAHKDGILVMGSGILMGVATTMLINTLSKNKDEESTIEN